MILALLKIGWYSAWRSRKSGSPLLLPALALVFVAIVWAVNFSSRIHPREPALEIYRNWSAMFLSFIVPLLCVFSGVGILREEVEGKTLVFLWTRPCGRVWPLFAKWLVANVVFGILSGIAVIILYVGIMLARGVRDDLLTNFAVVGWDSAALAVGSSIYLALGLLFSMFGKRAMTLAASYVIFVDFLAALLPGELRKLSMKIITLSLSASGATLEGQRNPLHLIQHQELVSLNEALATAGLLLAVLWLIIFVLLKTIEVGSERAAGAS